MATKSEKLERLVNARLDGSLSPKGKQELEKLLSVSEEARSYLREMEAVDDALRQTARQKATSDLSKKTMGRIREKKARTPVRQLSGRFNLQGRQMLRYAATLFIGLLLGATATILSTEERTWRTTDEMAGSMAARTGQKLSFAHDGWQVRISPMVVDNMWILVLSATSDEPLEVSLAYETEAYRLTRARYLSGTDAGGSIQAGSVSFGVSDTVHYQVILDQQSGMDAPFELEINHEGKVTYNRQFFLN